MPLVGGKDEHTFTTGETVKLLISCAE